MAKKWHYNHRDGRGRYISKAVGYDDYSEESGNKRYEGARPLVRFATDKYNPASLNGPVIIVQEGRKKPTGAENCVCCGEIIPEGRQVCPDCENGGKKDV